jgi:hypothetical protein
LDIEYHSLKRKKGIISCDTKKNKSFYSSLFIGKNRKGSTGFIFFSEKLDLYSLRPEKDVGSLPPSRLNKFLQKKTLTVTILHRCDP